MKIVISEKYKSQEAFLLDIVNTFPTKGNVLVIGKRNIIKIFNVGNVSVTVKSFKIPNLFNKIAYRFFRKSKAQRSFENASYLIKHNLGTPVPIAYIEMNDSFLFGRSFYVSKHIDFDLMYRDLVEDTTIANHEEILRAFTRFTHQLHEHHILFKDHSPGNTLIKKEGAIYNFYLVDLNRMEFKSLSFKMRIENFCRLTPKKEMVAIMSDEYSKITGEPYDKVFSSMWKYTATFQEKFYRKKRWKQLFSFK